MIQETIRGRRAVFPSQYNQEPISKEEILNLLEAANWAPTHRRTEPWRFIVFHGESQKKLGAFLAKTYEETAANFSEFKHKKIASKCEQSGAVIAICMQRDPEERVPEWEEVASVAMAVQNMWLAAHEMKIGAYWSSPSLRLHLGKHIPLSEGEQCLGFFYLGKYEGALEAGQRQSSIEEKTRWV